jgi:hypothetical protein
VLTLHALFALAQPTTIGAYLDGNFDALNQHGISGHLVNGLAFLSGAVALAYWLRGGRGWPFAALTFLYLLEGLQIGMGYARILAVHIPLGTAIVVMAVGMAAWSWTGRARRPRRGAWR